MNDPTVWAAIFGLAGIIATHWVARRQRAADAQALAAKAGQAVQDTYQELIADLRAQVTSAHEDATSARQSARAAQQEAASAEHNAWRAEQQALAMARFLHELRPVISQYVPGADVLLERIDKLTAARS